MDLELAHLFFGRDDAELDIGEGGLLLAGFLRTPAYEAARKARKHLIIGRKGSGKSAICRTLIAQEDTRHVTVLVTPDALSADEIRRFELQGVEPGMAKRMLWRYVFSVEIAKYLVAHVKAAHRKTPAAVARLRRFLIDNHELDVTRPKLYEAIAKLKTSLKLQAFGASVELGTSPSEGIRTYNQLEVLERQIELAVKELACPLDHPRLLVLVDQLEDVWSEEGESDSLVIGLLKAARTVGARFPRVACVVFLRSDIYEMLKFADKDKYRGDEMRVDWSTERLCELVLARARASLGVEISTNQLWGEVFPAEVVGRPARDYLVSHTLMRPRDIIHLCNLCRDTAEYNSHMKITEADVVESVRQYSDWKLEDLPNEYLANYPFLGGLLALFKDHGYIVTRGGLNRRLPDAREELSKRFPSRAAALTTDNVLDVLYEIGFLGVHRSGHVIYATHHGGRIELTDTEFHIHPAFRPALRATRASTIQGFEPEQLRERVRETLSGVLRRGTVGVQLLVTAQRGIERLLVALQDDYFPREVHHEVSISLLRLGNHLGEIHASHVEAIERIDHASVFLIDMADKLEKDGFGEEVEPRFFIRSIEDLGRRIRRYSRRGFSAGSGGEGSGSLG